MKYLVTGGTGFIGSNILNALKGDLLFTGCSKENKIFIYKYVGYDFSTIDWSLIGKVDVLFHQAAITDTTNYDTKRMMDVNVNKPLRLFEEAIEFGCRQIVYASSCAVYGDSPPPFRENGACNPLNIYGESKLIFDEKVKQFYPHANIVGLRYSNVYGRGEYHKKHMASMVWQIYNQIKYKKSPKLFEFGEQTRDFVYIKDVVSANLQSAKHQGSGVFNCGSGTSSSFNQIVTVINEICQSNVKAEYIKNPHGNKYQEITLCDMGKTQQELKHTPRWSLRDGIFDYFSNYARG
jgi:ADP-L-glycero-D-manno-heptose 6-epimerase